MSEQKLKTYDIASYDIELDFNKQIAPIEKQIEKLKSSHETKSLRSHKDFLTKEQKSKDTINQLQDKSVVKNQRIERAVENKLKKVQAKENRYYRDLEEYIAEKNIIADEAKLAIQEVIDELQKEEQSLIDEIKLKYKTNIESYVEKLDIYNNNFANNKATHSAQINEYQVILNDYMKEIEVFYQDVHHQLNERLQRILSTKDDAFAFIKKRMDDCSRVASNEATSVRKKANITISSINEYVDKLIAIYDKHYEAQIKAIEKERHALHATFEERSKLIDRDLQINIEKLEAQLEDLKESKNRKAKKNALTKMDLFNLRASTTLKYEQQMVEQQTVFLTKELKLLEQQMEFEVKNLEKLRIILLNDQNSLKETGDYFRDINIVLREQLCNLEYTNNDYLFRHEELKTDFVKRYTSIFKDLKQSTVEMAQTYLEKIADNNQEIDEINKFLDTAEPLKEIEVNRLRESIEINEVQERYKIKYAKQEYERNLIDNQLHFDITVQDIKTKELISEYNKEVSEIKNKEVFDKALEKAKLKHSKAQEVYKLRVNNTKLEQKLLSSKYETERDILVLQKDLVAISVRKDNALRSKEIEYAIKNYEIEANYKIEVIQKALEEDLLKLEEQTTKAKFEKDAYSANLNLEIEAKKAEINKQKQTIEQEKAEKVRMIETALERELREPTKNKIKTEAIIDERLSKLDVNNAIFVDFINDAIQGYQDDKLSLDQIRNIVLHNPVVFEKAEKYIARSFECLHDAIQFMSDIEIRNIENKIAATSDQGKIKRLTKQHTKLLSDTQKNIDNIAQSENDYIAVIKNTITSMNQDIKRVNVDSIDALLRFVEEQYHQILTRLTSIQEQILDEIKSLYLPLTKHDQELIDYANENALKAKELVQQELKDALLPLDQELSTFIQSKEEKRAIFNEQIDQQLSELKAQINHFKNDALDKVQEINQDKDMIVNEKLLQKQEIEITEDQEITKRHEEIDQAIDRLTLTFNIEMQRLDQKNVEAKKIFDYEDRIHAIAVESATARYNDANVKVENIHLNNVKQYKESIEQANRKREKNEHDYNQDLLDLTRSFEKNIFAVRPRLEESIGDAQKEIERQIAEKKSQLSDLQQNNQNIITSAENSLYTAFQEGYDRLSDNLQTYIDKYRIIEEDYLKNNKSINDSITNNNVQLGHSILEMAKHKHTKTLEELISVNAVMYRKEVR